MSARLSIFLGKGGVGRTTLACAFAVDRAVKGERVLLVSVVDGDDPLQRIEHEAAGVDTGGRLEMLHLDSRKLLDDIVRRVTRMGALAEFVINNPSYESLVDIVPGVREMAIFHELEKRLGGKYDRVVLDAPATGHGIHFLEAPEKTSKILAGPLRERAQRLGELLKDPARTDVVIVTLAEEMPIRETMELATTLKAQNFPLDNVVVNRWLPAIFESSEHREILDRLANEGAAWAAPLQLIALQRKEGEVHVDELRSLGVKLAIIPLIPESSRRLLRVAESMKELAP